MKTSELRTLSIEELLKKDQDVRENLFKLRFQHGIRRLENPAKLSQLKKEVARIQTVLTEMKANR
jgi:large subunit ribosomal protein L29